MLKEIQQVVRLLMVLIHRDSNQRKRTGGLLVLLSTETGTTASHILTCTVAAAGPWCCKISMEEVQREAVGRLSASASLCSPPDTEELCTFTETFGSLHFVLSFQDTQSVEVDHLKAERFLHRLSLVHAQVKIVFKLKDNEHTYQRVFSGQVENKLSLKDRSVVMDSTTYLQCPFSPGSSPRCCRMHPVVGDELTLLLPPDAVEAGLYGEMSVVPMATLGPCVDQYPNWPACVSRVHVLLYSPCNMPVMRGEGEAPMGFLQGLASALAWGELSLPGVRCAGRQPTAGSLFPEIVFSVESENSEEAEPQWSPASEQETEPQWSPAGEQETEPEWRRAVEQTLTLFLLFQHNDPFHSQLADFVASEEVLERHLDRVLWHNGQRVRAALQSVMENTLKAYRKRRLARVKMQSAQSVILSSVTSIVNSSSNMTFRTACLDNMRVQDTHEFSTSFHRSMQRVVDSRFVPRCRCNAGKCVSTETEAVAGTSSDQSGTGTREEPVLKRTDSQTRQVSSVAKRQRPGELGEEPATAHKQRLTETPLTPTPSPSDLEKQQVDSEWLQEIQNLEEWEWD